MSPVAEGLAKGTVARALSLALGEKGYREGAGNANKFSKALGRPAEAWCADFVEWALRTAGVPDVIKSAYCPTIEWTYKRQGRLHTTPRAGDQFFVYSPGQGRAIHTGLVLRVLDGGKSVLTIEGNTNTDGSANGIGVFVRVRPAMRAAGRVGIRSYGRPNYAQGGKAPLPTRVKPKGVQIKLLQTAVHVTPDGEWGPMTDANVQYLRAARTGSLKGLSVRRLQTIVGTRPDGAWGPISRKAYRRAVRLVQTALGVYPDGDWGIITDRAYQAARAKYRR